MNPEHEQVLLKTARASIAHGLEHHAPLPINLKEYPAELAQIAATFVTLKIQDKLRGCIGRLQATRPLIKDVSHNAFQAAFGDLRFPPLAQAEFNGLHIYLSILSTPEPIQFHSRDDLIKKIRPGIDGLILTEGTRHSTFLPSVWKSVTGPEEFLTHLLKKAGLPLDYWSNTIAIKRYTTETFGDT